MTRFTSHGSHFTSHFSLFTFLLLFTLHSSLFICCSQVKVGADLLLQQYSHLVKGKRVGLVTNHTGLLSSGEHIADVLHKTSGITLVALFGPEHGVRGDAAAGEKVVNLTDQRTGVPVFSLYGQHYKPTPEMLKGIDVLLFDIQDVGARFYTYISTLSYAMEAAAEQGIPFVVLDRPNPIGGIRIEGPIREDSLRSFVGLHPIPIIHGMTVGELAALFNGEGWLAGRVKARLTIVKLQGWRRTMLFDETGLKWIAPSPNIRSLESAIVYPGTCLVEGTNISEGRGTEKPFEYIGAPFVDGKRLAEELGKVALPGVTFEQIQFVPRPAQRIASNPKHAGLQCSGVFVHVTDRLSFEPVRAGIHLLAAVRRLYPREFEWRNSSIDRLYGTHELKKELDNQVPPESIVKEWDEQLRGFLPIRNKYLLY